MIRARAATPGFYFPHSFSVSKTRVSNSTPVPMRPHGSNGARRRELTTQSLIFSRTTASWITTARLRGRRAYFPGLGINHWRKSLKLSIGVEARRKCTRPKNFTKQWNKNNFSDEFQTMHRSTLLIIIVLSNRHFGQSYSACLWTTKPCQAPHLTRGTKDIFPWGCCF